MRRITNLLFATILLAGLTAAASAQDHFEGQISYTTYKITPDGQPQAQDDKLNMYITSDRILINDMNSYQVMGNLRSNGILIRLDHRDFVLLSDENQALKITKDDIDDMIAMMDGFSAWSGGNSSPDKKQKPEARFERTGREKEIAGYDCYEIVVTDSENPDDRTSMWMTNDLNVSWGMLTEPWGAGTAQFFPNGLPLDEVLSDGALPLRVEHYEGETLKDIMEASTVNASKVARAMVQVPQGVEVLGFRDYIIRQMQQQ